MGGLSISSQGMRAAWIAVALLWPVALLNYLDRQMLASMKFSVMGDVTDVATEANWGLMLGQFKWVYAFLSPLGGWVADRFGRKRTIVASLAAWSAVTWLTGSATTFRELLWTRTLMGFSEAFYIPAALALITDHHAAGTRSRAVGVHQTAIYAGVMLGGFGGYAAESPDLGWRAAFHAAGLVGLAYALPLAWLLREAPARTEQPAHIGVRQALRELLTSAPFLLLVACFTLPALPAWVVRDWMPAILKQQFGIGQGKAGVSASLWWNIAALGGAFAGGWLADRWSRSSARGRTMTSALGIALLVPALYGRGQRRLAWRGGGVPGAVRPWLGRVRLQQHAHPVPDRAARGAGHRLRPDEPGQHQLRRRGRHRLRRHARSRPATERHLHGVRAGGRGGRGAHAVHTPEARSDRSLISCRASRLP